jgi:hypothetical protein
MIQSKKKLALIAIALILGYISLAGVTMVDLTYQVMNVLPVANGGSGVATASANTIFSGPSSGSSAAPGFRAMVGADLPITSSTVGVGGLYSVGVPVGGGIFGTATTTPTNGIVYVTLLVPHVSQPLGHATVNVTTVGTSTQTLYVCVWNYAGTSLLWNANVVVSSGTGAFSAGASQYTLIADTPYWIGYIQAGSGAAVFATYGGTTNQFPVLNKQGVRYGTAATGQSSCPSSITLPLTSLTTALGDVMVALEP